MDPTACSNGHREHICLEALVRCGFGTTGPTPALRVISEQSRVQLKTNHEVLQSFAKVQKLPQ